VPYCLQLIERSLLEKRHTEIISEYYKRIVNEVLPII